MLDTLPALTRDRLQHALANLVDTALLAFGRRGHRPLFALPGVLLMLDAQASVLPDHGDQFLTRADLYCLPVEELLQQLARAPRPRDAVAMVLAIALRLDGDLFDAPTGRPDHLLLFGINLDHADQGIIATVRHTIPLSSAAVSIAPVNLAIDAHHDRLRRASPAFHGVPAVSLRSH